MPPVPLSVLLLFANLSYAYVSITTSSLPNGTVGVAYSATVQAPGGCPPYHWKIASGALPPGLTLSWPSTATYSTLAGKPTPAGTHAFTVWVEDCGGHTSSHAYKVNISPDAHARMIASPRPVVP